MNQELLEFSTAGISNIRRQRPSERVEKSSVKSSVKIANFKVLKPTEADIGK